MATRTETTKTINERKVPNGNPHIFSPLSWIIDNLKIYQKIQKRKGNFKEKFF